MDTVSSTGNFVSRYGEIDIVALEGHTLVFVEVRYRRPGSLVTPGNRLTPEKFAGSGRGYGIL